MHTHSNTFRPYFFELNSSRVIAQKAEYLGNDRSQTWTNVSSNGVLLIIILRSRFSRKNPIRRVFLDLVTYAKWELAILFQCMTV